MRSRWLLWARICFPAAGQFEVAAGDVLELGGAAFWAIHVVLLGKYASRFEAVSFSAGQMAVASALNWAASGFIEPLVLPFPPDLTRAILYTAIVSLGLGYTLQIWGQRHTPPTDAALILGLESIFAAMTGYIVLGERLSPVQLLGARPSSRQWFSPNEGRGVESQTHRRRCDRCKWRITPQRT